MPQHAQPGCRSWQGDKRVLRTDESGRLQSLRKYNILDTAHEDKFEDIISLVQSTFSVPVAAISLIDATRQWFKAAAGLHISQTPRASAICSYTIQGNTPFAVRDLAQDRRFGNNPLVTGPPGMRSYLGVPLTMADGYNIGALCILGTEPRHFSEDEIGLLQSFARITVRQIELRLAASRDDLTGALARGIFMEKLQLQLEAYQHASKPSCLALIDVDYFKQVNDLHGHSFGDQVLQRIVATINNAIRPEDLLGRLGGEEFGLLITTAGTHTARAISDRIRGLIAGLRFEGKPDLTITISMGLCGAHDGLGSAEDWFRRADIALYKAKSSGRNTLITANIAAV